MIGYLQKNVCIFKSFYMILTKKQSTSKSCANVLIIIVYIVQALSMFPVYLCLPLILYANGDYLKGFDTQDITAILMLNISMSVKTKHFLSYIEIIR